MPAATTTVMIDWEQCRGAASKNVRILPTISARFVRSSSLSPHSAKTYENPVRETACRKTDEFPVPARATLIGWFTTPSQ